MEDLKVTASGYDFKPAQAAMQRYVDGNLLSGISWAVMVGRDLVDVDCVGWADKEAQTRLRTDHIFRVFSNTKLITSCAALLLVEEGKLRLDDAIEKHIPQLGNRKVLRSARPRCMIPSRRRVRSPSASFSATAPGSATASSTPAPSSSRRSTSAACTIR